MEFVEFVELWNCGICGIVRKGDGFASLGNLYELRKRRIGAIISLIQKLIFAMIP